MGDARTPARPDAFLSYSRADGDFARRLVEALAEHGKDLWVDWDDIPKSSAWWDRVERGIESSRAVIALVSPDYAASDVCRRELDHAEEHAKHLVPVIRRDVVPAEIPDAVRSRNWILMRPSDRFDDALEELVAAVDADFAWLDAHARLLVRAREWEDNGRDGSFLLRGRDLREADEWLSTQSAHVESATPLQSEYIQAGKRSAARRQRVTLGSVAAALVVSLGLGVAAVWQWQRAVDRQHLAQSRELAASAKGVMAVDPRLGLERAVEAAHVKRSSQSDEALRAGLAEDALARALRLAPARTENVVFSRSGRLLLVVALDRAVAVVDVRRGTRRALRAARRGLGFEWTLGGFSADGTIAYAVDPDRVTFWRTADWSRAATWPGRFDSISVAPRAHLAATVTDRRVSLRQFPGGEPIRTLSRRAVARVTMAPSGRVLVTTGGGGPTLWHAPDWARPAAVDPAGDLAQLSDDGSLVAFTRPQGTGRLWRTSPVTKVLDYDAGRGLKNVLISPDRTVLATFGLADWLWGIRPPTGRIRAIEGAYPWAAPAFDARGDALLTAGDIDKAYVWDPHTGDSTRRLNGTGNTVAGAIPSPSLAVTFGYDGVLRSWELPAPVHVSRLANSYPSVAVDGRRVTAIAYRGDGALLWSARIDDTGRIGRWRHRRTFTPPETWTLSSTGRFGFGLKSGRYVVERTSDGAAVHRVRRVRVGGTVRTPAIAFSPADDTAAIETAQGVVTVYSTRDWRRVGVVERAGGVGTLAVSPRGTAVFTEGSFEPARLWDVRSHVARLLGGPVQGYDHVLFSPDGRRFATFSSAGPVEIRDVRGGAPVAWTDPLGADVASWSFNGDGSVLAALAEDGVVTLWDTANGNPLTTFTVRRTRRGTILLDSTSRSLLLADDGRVETWACPACVRSDDLLADAERHLRATRVHDPAVEDR